MTCTVRAGRLHYNGQLLAGSESLAQEGRDGESVQIFIRSRDTRLRRGGQDAAVASGVVVVEGTLAQLVLAEGGHHQGIVDVDGKQWFVDEVSEADARPGERVQIEMRAQDVLMYRNDRLIESSP